MYSVLLNGHTVKHVHQVYLNESINVNPVKALSQNSMGFGSRVLHAMTMKDFIMGVQKCLPNC